VTTLDPTEFAVQLRGFSYTAFRLELQRQYHEEGEPEAVAKFLAGHPEPATANPGLRDWYAQVEQQTSQGRRVERVRVHDDPPTDYQRWERWIDTWNVDAGETIHYLTRDRAQEIELLPAAGTLNPSRAAGAVDWWLLDSNRLIVMHFDEVGRRLHNELVVDPAMVVQACAWRDLAIHHSAPSGLRNAVT
jgi:hypothetical protein